MSSSVETHVRVRHRLIDGHVHVAVWTGRGPTHGLAGLLAFSEEEWPAVRGGFVRSGWELINDDLADHPRAQLVAQIADAQVVRPEIPRAVAERFVEHADLVAIVGMGDPIAEVQALIGSALEGDG